VDGTDTAEGEVVVVRVSEGMIELRIRKRCPLCGTPPALRVTAVMVASAEGIDAQTVVLSVQCPACKVPWAVTAGDVQGAA
jgi:hypothetical protein